jgi:hypothetical protein
MQEITKSSRPIKVAPTVFVAALSLAFIAGWLMGLAPEYLSTFGTIILYWVSMPTCLVLLVIGTIEVIGASDITGISASKDSMSFVLSPEDLSRWRSIKKGMDRHEVVAILGQPDGPPVAVLRGGLVNGSRRVCYKWGTGAVLFEPNSGPVTDVEIPEYF